MMHDVTTVQICVESWDGQGCDTREKQAEIRSACANFLYEERLDGVSSERSPIQSNPLWPKHVAEVCYNLMGNFWSPW